MGKKALQRFDPFGAVVVAQLVERSLPTPENRGSNPNIAKVLSINCKLNRKDKDIEKEEGMAHI